MAEIRRSGTWSSALSADEFTAIKSTGFEPVGQVLGAAVYNIGYTGGYACPAYGSGYNMGRLGPYGGGMYNTVTATSGGGTLGSYAPLVRTMYEARRQAIGRMMAECQELGGHGVVGVALTIGGFPAGGLEFKAIGTAVRAPGGMPLRQPFTSDLTGQDFAKLIMAEARMAEIRRSGTWSSALSADEFTAIKSTGFEPVGLVLGIAVGSRHDDWITINQTRYGSGNVEVQGYTDLVNATRHDARNQLERDVARHGAEGVVLQAMEMRVGEHECPVQEGRRDHVVEATIIGTAIAHFGQRRTRETPPPLAIMSLDPQRRQAARVRLGP
jgi:uncharacterized protein YbjQ (UPF0145 family)